MDQCTQVMQCDLTDLLGSPGPRGSAHQPPHWPQAGKAGVALPLPCLPGVCWGHGTGSGGRWLSALQAPPLPPALLERGPIITVESQRCLNPRIPGTPRGGPETCPILPDCPGPCPHIREQSPATVRSSAAFLPQLGSWRNLPCCQRGNPERTPIFPPGLECEGVVPPSAHGGHWGLACPLLASRDSGRNSRILEGGEFN